MACCCRWHPRSYRARLFRLDPRQPPFQISRIQYLLAAAATAAKSPQSCPTLCDPIDGSPPGSSVHQISQAGVPEWVAISFSRGSCWPRDWTWVSCFSRRVPYHWATQEASVLLAARKCSPWVSAQHRGASGTRWLGGGPKPSVWQAGLLQIWEHTILITITLKMTVTLKQYLIYKKVTDADMCVYIYYIVYNYYTYICSHQELWFQLPNASI